MFHRHIYELAPRPGNYVSRSMGINFKSHGKLHVCTVCGKEKVLYPNT